MADVLTAAQITSLLAGTRNRGGHERVLRKFAESGEMYVTISDMPEYAEKVKANLTSVKNTLQMKAKACELPVRLLKVDDATLIAVNTDIVATAAGEEDSEEDVSE
jgi:hypothetical protein